MMVPMATVWTCPNCKRTFGKTNQGHMCAPAMTEDEYFSTGPVFERPIYEEVKATLLTADPDVRFEYVSVGVFFKKKTNFAELRPLTKWSKLMFKLPRDFSHPDITKKWPGPSRTYYEMKLRTPADVTDEVRGWLIEAAAEDA
jgi:hypothetical protein